MKTAKQLQARNRRDADIEHLERRLSRVQSGIETDVASLIVPSALSAFVVMIGLQAARWLSELHLGPHGLWVAIPAVVALTAALFLAVIAARNVVLGFQASQITFTPESDLDNLTVSERRSELLEALTWAHQVYDAVGSRRNNAYNSAFIGLAAVVVVILLSGLGLWLGWLYNESSIGLPKGGV